MTNHARLIRSIFNIKLVATAAFFLGFSVAYGQYCTPTYSTVCFSPATFDVIDSFWTEGGETNISNLNTDCSMLPNNYWNTGMVVSGCPGDVITTNVQCEVGTYTQGFAIWIDWNSNFTFEPGEKVFSSPTAGDFVHTGSFTIPMTATSGETFRMRVRSNFATGGAGITPCANQVFGETEDYIVEVATCDATICEGDTAVIDLATYTDLPPEPLDYLWSPTTDLSDPMGGPIVEAWPTDSVEYTVTINSPSGSETLVIPVNVVKNPNPDAGLDLELCHDPTVPQPLNVTIDPDVDPTTLIYDWEMDVFTGAGSPFVLFSPDDDIPNPNLQVSEPGIYSIVVYVEDEFGVCSKSDTVEVLFSGEEHTTEVTDPVCFGQNSGTITVNSTGTLGAVEYSIDGGATWQLSNLFTDLPSGMYTVMSRDEIGCEFESEVELIDPDAVTITVSEDTTICQNGTATLIAEATGGVSYTYDWSIPGADMSGTQTIMPTATITSISVTVSNEVGCLSPTENIVVTLRDPISLTVSENDSVCPGYASGANVVAAGGDGDYTYSWTIDGASSSETSASIGDNPDVETTYCVTVADGCETTPVEICTKTVMRPVPNPSFYTPVTQGCDPTTFDFTTVVDATDSVTWSMNGRVFHSTDPSVEFEGVGFYDVSLEVYNQYGCFNEITVEDYIEIVDIPYPEIFINPNPTNIFYTTVGLNAVVDGDGNSFYWTMPGGDPETSTNEDPTVTYPDGIAGEYPVELTVTNALGCVNTVKDVVRVLSDVIIYAPTAFTPDGDQYNETWRIYMDGIDIYDYHCTLFNKWGEIIWESYNVEAEWDGTYGSEFVQDGTYVWVVEAKEQTSDRRVEFRGFVNVLR